MSDVNCLKIKIQDLIAHVNESFSKFDDKNRTFLFLDWTPLNSLNETPECRFWQECINLYQLFQQLDIKLKPCDVQCCEIICRRFRAADQFEATICTKQNLRGTKLTIVVITHAQAMRTGIVNHQHIADFTGRKHAVDGKLVVKATLKNV